MVVKATRLPFIERIAARNILKKPPADRPRQPVTVRWNAPFHQDTRRIPRGLTPRRKPTFR